MSLCPGERFARWQRAWACLALLTTVARGASGQQKPDTIVGIVRSRAQGIPLASVQLILTSIPDRRVFRASTDANGQFRFVVLPGSPDYLLHAAAPGWSPTRKAVPRTTGTGGDSIELFLDNLITTLGPTIVRAERRRVLRDGDSGAGTGSLAIETEGLVGQIAPELMGDLDAIAGTLPGLSLTPNGRLSVLGLDPSQNQATLNGMPIDGLVLPRDTKARTRVLTSSFDPSVGGFSGARLAVELSPGGVVTQTRGHVTFETPSFDIRRVGVTPTTQRSLRMSMAREGELLVDRAVYTIAAQASRTSLRNLVVPSGRDGAGIWGVDPSAMRDMQTRIQDFGFPLASSDRRSSADEAIVIGRLDQAREPTTASIFDAKDRWSITGYGRVRRTSGDVFDPFRVTAASTETRTLGSALQLSLSKYVGRGKTILWDGRVGAFAQSAQSYYGESLLPAGAVYLPGDPKAPTTAAGLLRFGRPPTPGQQQGASTIETNHQLQFYPVAAPQHRLKLTMRAAIEASRFEMDSLDYREFFFDSPATLSNGRPASLFVDLRPTSGAESRLGVAAASIGDYWQIRQGLEVIYGARLDAHRFFSSPFRDSGLLAAFGRRTDRTAARLDVSPRIGFAWQYGSGPGNSTIASQSAMGTTRFAARGVVRGGIGAFRSDPRAEVLLPAIASLNPSSGEQEYWCVGNAVPAPSWSVSAPPPDCANPEPLSLKTVARSLRFGDGLGTTARTLRAQMNWSEAVGSFRISVDGTYSRSTRQQSRIDLNLQSSPSFWLTNENRRPVFTPAIQIDTVSGLAPLDASRRDHGFGRVVESVADLESRAQQITAMLTPFLPGSIGRWTAALWYTYTDGRVQGRGFDAPTAGDPREAEWSSLSSPRHVAQIQAGYLWRGRGIAVTGFARASSGRRFTPVVGQDINGDGLPNDRAFVDGDLPTSFTESLDRRVRDCLLKRPQEIADRNSCSGPPVVSTNLRIDWWNGPASGSAPWRLSLNLRNPLLLLDQTLNGPQSSHGILRDYPLDPVLYYIRGFDARRLEYRRELNPGFGHPRPGALPNATAGLSLDLTYALGRDPGEQLALRMLRPGRGDGGQRPSVDTLAGRLLRTLPDPYASILSLTDSLGISSDQTSQLQRARDSYLARSDSLARIGSQALLVSGSSDMREAARALQEANRAISALPRREGTIILRILTREQVLMLPDSVLRLIPTDRR